MLTSLELSVELHSFQRRNFGSEKKLHISTLNQIVLSSLERLFQRTVQEIEWNEKEINKILNLPNERPRLYRIVLYIVQIENETMNQTWNKNRTGNAYSILTNRTTNETGVCYFNCICLKNQLVPREFADEVEVSSIPTNWFVRISFDVFWTKATTDGSRMHKKTNMQIWLYISW